MLRQFQAAGKAASPDKIPTTITKDVGDISTKRLTIIFNSSLTNGVFQIFGKLLELLLLSIQVQKMMSVTIGPFQSSQFSQGS